MFRLRRQPQGQPGVGYREQMEAFGERLRPILVEVGINPGEPEILGLHNIIKR